MNELDKAKNIVEKILNVKVANKKRNPKFVDARRILSELLRHSDVSEENIGHSIGKDRTTVMHYRNTFDDFVKSDAIFREKYARCSKAFFNTESDIADEYLERQKLNLQKSLDQISAMQSEKDRLQTDISRYGRLNKIVELIRAKVPSGKEEFVYYKMLAMLNGLPLKQ